MWTIENASAAIEARTLTPVQLLDQCLARIDRDESQVGAWVFVAREEARAQAEALTRELERGHWRGPLHGIPLGVKDIFDVFDWPTAAGSKLWSTSIARQDSTAVARLRQAGAVFVGKTVTTAYASFDPPPTRNPWDPRCTPGGSSSGSAAAVACGMCLGALASQTGGSITRPAAFCGVPSIKPTFGRIGLTGVVPLAPPMDHVGFMAGSVRGLALLFQATAGPDPRDPACLTSPPPEVVHISEMPLRIGRLRGFFDHHATKAARDIMEQLDRQLVHSGVTVENVPEPPDFWAVTRWHAAVMAVEAAAYHQSRLARHPEDYPPRIRHLIETGLSTPAPEYAKSREHQVILARAFEPLFERYSVLLTPAATGPAPSADTTGDPVFNSPWSFTGLPTISIPIAWTESGLPLSAQLIGPRGREDILFHAAARCEEIVRFPARERTM